MGRFGQELWFVTTQLQQNTQAAASSSDSGGLVGWMLAFVMAIGITMLVARPLLFPETVGRTSNSEKNRSRLENLQDKVTAENQALQDLEFDYELGAIEEKDYSFFRQKTDARLAALSQEIQQAEQDLNPVAATLPVLATENGLKSKNGQVASTVKKITGEFSLKGIVKDKLKCGECNTSFKPGSRFCAKCSTPLPLLCLTCGKEITEADRFCSKCGSAVNT